MKLLIIEDHEALRVTLDHKLKQSGYQTQAIACIEDLIETPLEAPLKKIWDVALIDINLPGKSGYEIAKDLKNAVHEINIIMMTVRTQIKDKLIGYESGADYYLPKPIDYNELLAILKVIVRNKNLQHKQNKQHLLTLNLETAILVAHQGAAVRLSQQEVAMINAFMMAENQHLDYWQLYSLLNLNEASEKNALEVKVSRLRKKIDVFSSGVRSIQSVRGEGYKLNLNIKLV